MKPRERQGDWIKNLGTGEDMSGRVLGDLQLMEGGVGKTAKWRTDVGEPTCNQCNK